MANVEYRPAAAAPFLHFTPLVGMTPTQIAERLRAFGMHPKGSTDPGYHGQAATLTLRSDTTVDDALEALFSSFRQIGGIVDALEMNAEIPREALGMIEGMHVLLQLAAGQFFVVDHAIREHQPDEDLSAERSRWIKAAHTIAHDVALDLNAAARLIGVVLANGDGSDDAATGALAIVERCGLKVDQIAKPLMRVHERPIDWVLSPAGRDAASVLATSSGAQP